MFKLTTSDRISSRNSVNLMSLTDNENFFTKETVERETVKTVERNDSQK